MPSLWQALASSCPSCCSCRLSTLAGHCRVARRAWPERGLEGRECRVGWQATAAGGVPRQTPHAAAARHCCCPCRARPARHPSVPACHVSRQQAWCTPTGPWASCCSSWPGGPRPTCQQREGPAVLRGHGASARLQLGVADVSLLSPSLSLQRRGRPCLCPCPGSVRGRRRDGLRRRRRWRRRRRA